ncbi:fungal-specific transcription factor domain-containing protein [Penicillium cosmopolitanum]|uniref:Fungal-specific transcription factor domain-containing protein n=1 Tax=Penicillium cosmopolitanum TaxID=1131564 RepID=A0A9W9SHL0_9EURO|nr:fungal-specific transcription factor domain-containing protein [Penicillium cosmopolitanum]KAJ5378515.1 fungal-specific transcription factor domain-containing protein [Penicillium cosmopolitanum]
MPPPVPNSRYKAAVREQRVRAITACEYCRQKKLKCSNDRPICQQCQARGKDCAYVETPKLPRPSKARISRLEEENRYLKDSLANFEQGLRPQRVDKTAESQTSAEFASKSLELMSVHTPELWNGRRIEGRQNLHYLSTPPLDPQPFSQVDTVAQSHGPTSAVTDEITSNLDMMAKGRSHHAEELEALQNALFANSARLSQMEKINFNSSRFDFDGVDSRVAMRLLSLYWDRQLDVGAVVYRPTFMRDMACHGPYFSKLLLNAIYFTASKYCSHEEVFDDRTEALTAGRRFRRRAMELIGDHITKSEIPTVQALLLLSHALFNWCDEKSLSWLYSGMAINMIIDLGLHTGHKTDPRVGKLAPEDIEARQRVFWGAYSIDKFLSLYQGRCIRLCDADTSLYPRFLDEFEEYETLQASSYANVNGASDLPAHNISILKGYCSLSIIMSGILDTLYTERSTLKEPNSLLEASSSLYHQLKNWLKSIPSVLTDTLSQMSRGIASPHILSLRALYHTLEILLHRPFVSDGHLRGVSLSAAPLAFNTCVSAASSIDQVLTCYREMFSTRFAPYTLSYATYVSATIHARVAAQSPSDSQAHASLQRCVSTLREHQELSLGPKESIGGDKKPYETCWH